jgi:chromosome segregation ATPase
MIDLRGSARIWGLSSGRSRRSKLSADQFAQRATELADALEQRQASVDQVEAELEMRRNELLQAQAALARATEELAAARRRLKAAGVASQSMKQHCRRSSLQKEAALRAAAESLETERLRALELEAAELRQALESAHSELAELRLEAERLLADEQALRESQAAEMDDRLRGERAHLGAVERTLKEVEAERDQFAQRATELADALEQRQASVDQGRGGAGDAPERAASGASSPGLARPRSSPQLGRRLKAAGAASQRVKQHCRRSSCRRRQL